jgi:hypothetical protein
VYNCNRDRKTKMKKYSLAFGHFSNAYCCLELISVHPNSNRPIFGLKEF